jgi:hypothetical protein
MTTFCSGVCIVTWLSGMVSGLYWKFIHYTVQLTTVPLWCYPGCSGRGRAGAGQWGPGTCQGGQPALLPDRWPPAARTGSSTGQRCNYWTAFLVESSLLRLRFLSGFLPSFYRSTKFYSWKTRGFLLLIFLKYVYSMEQKTRVFCQINVQAFHLWRHAQ